MTDILNDLSTWSILKWVIIVLVAGFIGQFGKTMAQAVIGKMRRKKTPENIPARSVSGKPVTDQEDVAGTLTQDHRPSSLETTGATDKKSLKIIAKQQKKAAKQAK